MHRLLMASILGAVLASVACGSDPAPPPVVEPEPEKPQTVDPQFGDAEALGWLTKECAGCHGMDATTGATALYYSSWPMPAVLTREWLEVSETSAAAYQTLVNKITDAPGQTPSPMPIDPLVADQAAGLRATISWFHTNLPLSVIDANAQWGGSTSAEQKVALHFKCKNTVSLRTFMSRMTLGLFDRPPRPAELAWFPAAELDVPVTRAQREMLVGKLPYEWNAELRSIGLRKLAMVVGGGPGIQAVNGLTPEVATDLKEEMHHQLLANYDGWSWRQYFASDVVWTTARTAPLYGCAAPTTADGWGACTLQAPRAGFFTTVGFLASKPQSFLLENNNHGRMASTYFTLYGEQLRAATTGPTGSAAIPPLPSCLEATDTRLYKGAPRGVAAIPQFGQVCQSCHVQRPMAAGALLFRPFSTSGIVYTADTLGTTGSADLASFTLATSEGWTHDGAPVDAAFLRTLLTAPPQACVATGKTFVPVKNVAELAGVLMNNRGAFARGFVRHAHRAFSNASQITLEMGLRATEAVESGRDKAPDLIAAYLLSESFSCGGGTQP